MKLCLLLTFLCITALSYVATNEAANNNDDQMPTSKPLVVMSGEVSHVAKPLCRRLASPEEWARVWASHLGTTVDDAYRPILEIDFDRCLIVAIFRGREANVLGIEINSLSEVADLVIIRFSTLGYQSAGEDADEMSRPYAFIVLPKSNKTIVLQENVQQNKSGEPQWKEYARLVADKK